MLRLVAYTLIMSITHFTGGLMKYAVVEKKNRLAVHGLFDSKERAERHIREVIPGYVAKSYFMDKKLTANSFRVREYRSK